MSDQKPTYKHILVPVPMSEDYEIQTIRRQTGTRMVEKPKGILNPKMETKEVPIFEFVEEELPTGTASDTMPDSVILGDNVEDACNDLAADGYSVISITPILRGVHGHQLKQGLLKKGTGNTGYAFGFGFSVTDSILIVAKKD